MTKYEHGLLLAVAQGVVLQLRAKLAEIENLHPRESALAMATFQERLRHIEDLLGLVKKDDHYLDGS